MPPAASASARPSWFLGAPMAKLLTGFTVLSFFVVHRQNAVKVMAMDSTRIATQPYRYWTSKITFSRPGEVVVGTLLLSFLARKMEREMGSVHFCVFLVLINLLSMALEAAWIATNVYSLEYMGPYPLLGALFALFHWSTPCLYPRLVSILGFSFSEKALYYLWLAQVVLYNRWSAVIVTGMGGLAAALYTHSKFLQTLDCPPFLVSLVRPLAERLTEPPPHLFVPQGAAVLRPGAGGAGAGQQAPTQRAIHPVFGQAAPGALPGQVAATQRNPPPPDPAAMEQLLLMGFDRDQVVAALQFADNDVNRAADRLLTQQATGM